MSMIEYKIINTAILYMHNPALWRITLLKIFYGTINLYFWLKSLVIDIHVPRFLWMHFIARLS